MLPVDFAPVAGEPTRLFVYPFGKTKESLHAVSKGEIDPHLGFKMRYVNPATGGPPMATIGAFAQRLPAGYETRPYRCTDGTIYVCLEGNGTADVGGQSFAFSPSDVFVVPSWHALRMHAGADTILFSFSDRPAQQALGLWRQEKMAGGE